MQTKAVKVREVEQDTQKYLKISGNIHSADVEVYEEVRDNAHKCSNCGFIKIGGEIPEVCPSCGGKKAKFVLVTQKLWKCSVCGYIHEGPQPPELCPVCGAGSEEFYEVKI